MKYAFQIGKQYSRKDVKKIIGATNPDNIGGDWATGQINHDNCYIIFANLESAGRTGHNYGNILQDNCLYWHSKKTARYGTRTIKRLLSGEHEIYIFTRVNSANLEFTFNGLGYVKDIGNKEEERFHIVWGLTDNISKLPDGLQYNNRITFIEGVRQETLVTKYERSRKAREACLEHWGYSCVVCDMNFAEIYGEIGRGFIHVHHLREISSIGEEYQIDAISDLRPICPNCHAMIHRRKPAYSIEQIRKIINTTSQQATTTL